jgi:MFS family permease
MSILAVLLVQLALDVAIKMDWIDEPAGWFPWDLHVGGWEWQISFKLFTKMLLTVVGIGAVYWWLQGVTGEEDLPRPLFLRRFWVLVVVVVMINTAWHFFRAWLPLILQDQHGYGEQETYWFVLSYYVATDLGSLTAGFAALTLVGWGMSVHGSRMTVFLFCTLLTSLSVIVAILPAGWLLLGLLLIIGFGALGLFPQYYSFSQELTTQHQGKLTGALGCINWLAMSLLHEVVGDSVKQTGNYSQGVCLAGLAPLLGLLVLLLFWGRSPATEPEAVKATA